MADEPQDVTADDTATDSSAETNDEVVESQEEATAEPVDESGVPLRNRQAEQDRKAKRLSQAEAQSQLVSGATETSNEMTQDEAVKAVEDIADTRVRKAMEPLLAKQFLLEHPDARDMIEDINLIRAQKSHLKGVEHLEDVYKIVKADRQDELLRQQVESEQRDKQVRQQAASQSSAEGVGKTKSSTKTDDLATRIANAKTMEELQSLGASIGA